MALFMEEEVKRGIALLDKEVPGWELAGRLVMESKQQCVLGKVFGHYSVGLRKLGISESDAVSYGFTLPMPSLVPTLPFPRHPILRELWEQWDKLGATWEASAKEHMKPLLPNYLMIDEAILMEEFIPV